MSKARQLADLGNQVDDGAITGSNMVVNGAMTVAQRGTSVAGVTNTQYSTVDRFEFVGNIGTRTNTQETDAPSGFSNSLKVEITTAETPPASGDYLTVEYKMEGQDLQHLKKGTADAVPVTVSFWVKSNVTGTYILEFDDNDNARNINKSYTVNASATWEYKTITFEGDTTGVLDNNNAFSARLIWWLDAGSAFRGGTLATSWEATQSIDRVEGNVSLGATVGNYFQITGVCLNVGDSAIDFPHESYGDELQRCQRYYYQDDTANHFLRSFYAPAVGDWYEDYPLPVVMRATPTWTSQLGGDVSKVNAVSISGRTAKSGYVRFTVSSTGQGYCSLNTVTADAEL
jgi:hypothetical protein